MSQYGQGPAFSPELQQAIDAHNKEIAEERRALNAFITDAKILGGLASTGNIPLDINEEAADRRLIAGWKLGPTRQVTREVWFPKHIEYHQGTDNGWKTESYGWKETVPGQYGSKIIVDSLVMTADRDLLWTWQRTRAFEIANQNPGLIAMFKRLAGPTMREFVITEYEPVTPDNLGMPSQNARGLLLQFMHDNREKLNILDNPQA